MTNRLGKSRLLRVISGIGVVLALIGIGSWYSFRNTEVDLPIEGKWEGNMGDESIPGVPMGLEIERTFLGEYRGTGYLPSGISKRSPSRLKVTLNGLSFGDEEESIMCDGKWNGFDGNRPISITGTCISLEDKNEGFPPIPFYLKKITIH